MDGQRFSMEKRMYQGRLHSPQINHQIFLQFKDMSRYAIKYSLLRKKIHLLWVFFFIKFWIGGSNQFSLKMAMIIKPSCAVCTRFIIISNFIIKIVAYCVPHLIKLFQYKDITEIYIINLIKLYFNDRLNEMGIE